MEFEKIKLQFDIYEMMKNVKRLKENAKMIWKIGKK